MSHPSDHANPYRGDVSERLDGLRQQLAASNPDHYRQLALYLQVLRQCLPGAVDQAVFHLATQIAPERYMALPGLKRQALHRQLDDLVQRCTSLLTVEQLAHLAGCMALEVNRRQDRQRSRWLEQLGRNPEVEPSSAGEPPDELDPESPEPAQPLPAGSVVLGLDLPLGAGGGWLWSGREDGRAVDAEPPDEHSGSAGEGPDADAEGSTPITPWDLGFADFNAAEELNEADDPEAELDDGSDEPEARAAGPWSGSVDSLPAGLGAMPWMQPRDAEADPPSGDDETWEDAIWPLSSQGLEREAAMASPAGEAQPGARTTGTGGSGLTIEALVAGLGRGSAAGEDPESPQADERLPEPWRSGCLPTDPGDLLSWLTGFDLALARRLRNLSHAINLELLRHGLSATLLPPALLDAVLHGRLEAQAAPPNLLKLPLPLISPTGTQGLTGHALLLRRGDLEAEHPKLRTCRQRLQQRRQDLRKMAHLSVRLQRRLRTQDAERLWMQTVRRTRPPAP